jgi:hypothetical protein
MRKDSQTKFMRWSTSSIVGDEREQWASRSDRDLGQRSVQELAMNNWHTKRS